MSKRHVNWAHKAKFTLQFALGGRCIECGTTKNLEFDCINPQGHRHHAIGFVRRICFYRKQHVLNNLQLLCRKCHIKKSVKEHQIEIEENTPF